MTAGISTTLLMMVRQMTIMIAIMITITTMILISPVIAAPTTTSNAEIYGIKGQFVKFSWTVDCGLLGQNTIAVFRIVAKIDNVTIDNDEYSMHYYQNWDVNSSGFINSTTDTGNAISTNTHGGYKIGQKKVIQFKHIYTESRSYDATLTATIIAPNHPYIHNVQHSANYTIAISDVLCFATTGMSESKNDTSSNNNVFSHDDDDFVPVRPTQITMQNASSSEQQGETPSSSSSSSSSLSPRMLLPNYATFVVVSPIFLLGFELLRYAVAFIL